jgi:hypothetical protein
MSRLGDAPGVPSLFPLVSERDPLAPSWDARLTSAGLGSSPDLLQPLEEVEPGTVKRQFETIKIMPGLVPLTSLP